MTETTSYGVLAYGFGVFLLPMEHDLGWSRSALAGAYSLAIVVSGVAAIPVGRWPDRHGARVLMTAGSTAATVLVLAWAHVTGLGAYYAIWGGRGEAKAPGGSKAITRRPSPTSSSASGLRASGVERSPGSTTTSGSRSAGSTGRPPLRVAQARLLPHLLAHARVLTC